MNSKKKSVKKEVMEREKPLQIEMSFEEAMKATMLDANKKMKEKRAKKS